MADYYTLLTNAGIAYETACKAAGTPIKLTQMSVGDGGAGGVYNPDATATALKREVWRGNLNALFQDSANPSWLLAEVTIPPEVGGWYVREAGLWTDTGILYAIIKYPESFKPVLASSGSGKEFYIRAIFETSNAALVTLSIDDTIVKATRAWVASFVAEELAKLDNKQSVRVATTVNIALVGAQTIDGVAVVAGDRVLVKNQTQARENGLYVVANGAWVRAKDADSSVKVTPNMIVAVEVGATQADTIWQLITDGVIVVGVTALTFKDITDGFARLFSPSFAGNPTAPTPAQFDSSKSVATTEFVRRRGVEYSGFTSNNASLALSAVHVGGLHSFSDAAQLTVTLPPTAGVAQGATITLASAGPGGLKIVGSGADVIYTSTGVAGPLVLALGDTAEFIRLQDQWRLIGGTAALRFAGTLSGPYYVTQPQFDSGKSPATTEFVKRMGVEWSSFNAISVSTVLSVASVGGAVSAASSTPISLTLPPTGLVVQGAMVMVLSAGSGAVTLQLSSGDLLTNVSGVSVSVVLGQGDTALLTRVSNEWRLIAGTVALRHSAAFASSLSNIGYAKRPDGLIEQWGVGVTDANGYVYVTYPIPFPNGVRNVTPMHFGSSALMHAVMDTNYTMAGCKLRVQNAAGAASAGWQVFWRALGN
jgi:hypothetical protein